MVISSAGNTAIEINAQFEKAIALLEKSRRMVRPLAVGEMEYAGKPFMGLRAFCQSRGEERTFRVDRILEMKGVG